MIGCRVYGTLLLLIAAIGVTLAAGGGNLGGVVSVSMSELASAIEPTSPYVGAYGAVPVLWTVRLAAEIASALSRIPWFVFILPLALGLLLRLRKRWHSNDIGRPLLDGAGLLGVEFLAAWNIIACLFALRALANRLTLILSDDGRLEQASALLWASTPLWSRSLTCFITVFLCLTARRRVRKREYTGVYWLVGAALLTAADNVLSAIVSGLGGSEPLACALACWPAAVAVAVWWYFVKSGHAHEYLD